MYFNRRVGVLLKVQFFVIKVVNLFDNVIYFSWHKAKSFRVRHTFFDKIYILLLFEFFNSNSNWVTQTVNLIALLFFFEAKRIDSIFKEITKQVSYFRLH